MDPKSNDRYHLIEIGSGRFGTETLGEEAMSTKNRDGREAATNPGAPRATRDGKEEAFCLGLSEGRWLCGHLAFRLFIPKL